MRAAQSREIVSQRILIHGAGSVGCYLGGLLAAAGASVTLLGRPRLQTEVHEHGMLLTDLHGRRCALPSSNIEFVTDPAALANADLVLVTVKNLATDQAAAELLRYAKRDTLVLSLQNGVSNVAVLRQRLPEQTVLAGMVPFNVVHRAAGHWHRGTEGELVVARHPPLQVYVRRFADAALPLTLHDDMNGVLWGKLLLNLNNAINALAGLPLREQLQQRAYRRCLALCIEEALALLRKARITPTQVGRIPPRRMPFLLRLPDWLFSRLAKRMLLIDPLARSSMWEDLEQGRHTEIDYLNGEIVRLAAASGLVAATNARVTALVKAAERGSRRDWPGVDLWEQLRRAR
jgi:2-dehydropantoate 2-reductase